jgi:ankyrin repeat protein
MHLVCGTGNLEIFKELVNAGLALDCYDKHSRTPIMFAVRNHNHGIVEEIIRMKGKYYKEDSSFNTVLHYAAAFGNLRFLPYLLERMRQKKNKRSYYPWEIAVGKGHIGCAMILQ